MDARCTLRKNQRLDECQVAPELFEPVIPRLHTCIEAWMQRSQSKAGLADYEVRHWTGWQPQHTRS